MTTASRRTARLLLLVALVLGAGPAPSAAANNCAEGGRSRPDEGGVGGTGVLSTVPEDEGGIGGTGIAAPADTGIIGTVTGFASICVGGVEIHYAAATPVEIDGERAAAARLAVGQVVEVTATGSGAEVNAQQISVHHVVSGPVTRVDAGRNALDVVGQTVQLSAGTRAGDESVATTTAFQLGSSVQVSGMRRSDGVIVASRVALSPTGETVRLTGPVSRSDSGTLAILGTPLQVADPAHLVVGAEARVVGRWDGSAIVTQSVQALSRLPFDGRVARIEIEGYAQQAAAGRLQVGTFDVDLPEQPDSESAQLPGLTAPVRVQAVVRGDHVIVERVTVMGDLPIPPGPGERAPRGWNGAGPDGSRHGNEGPPPLDQPRPDDGRAPAPGGGRDTTASGIPDARAVGMPPRPDAPDRPAPPQIPDRPPQMPDRPPQMPDRPPQLPDRPPQLPDRPPRIDRPILPERPPGRPDIPGRR